MQLLKWPRRLVVVCCGEASGQSPGDGLSGAGVRAARDAGKMLISESWQPHSVFVAPDLAARQTAALVLRAIGLEPDADLVAPRCTIAPSAGGRVSVLGGPVEVAHDERLRDLDPGWPGSGDGPQAESADLEGDARVRLAARPPGGESHHDVTLRVRSFLADLGRPHAGETLLVVTHKAVLAAVRRLLDPLPAADAERDLAALLAGPPRVEGFDSGGPLARQRLLQGYYRVAEVTQKGATTVVSRLRRRSGLASGEGQEFGIVPADSPAGALAGKVLITYLSAGNGHRIAAQALEAELKARYPSLEVLPPADLADLSRTGKWQAAMFYKVVDWHLYSNIYSLADRLRAPARLGPVRQELVAIASGRLKALLDKVRPDAVINCHPHGTELLAGLAGELSHSILNYQVVTDCYGHAFYVLPGVSGTFVPNPDVAAQLASKGMPPSSLFVTGIPIHPIFAETPEPGAVRDLLGLSRMARVLLVQGNLLDDIADYLALLERLDLDFPEGAAGNEVHVLVACGKNEALKGELETLAGAFGGRIKLRAFGPLTSAEMRDVMRAADLSLTKPGGLTTAESLAMELPMVLLEVMGGGQERYNADYFHREGAGVIASDPGEAIREVASLLAQPGRLSEMRHNASRLARPLAAQEIARTVTAGIAASAARRR